MTTPTCTPQWDIEVLESCLESVMIRRVYADESASGFFRTKQLGLEGSIGSGKNDLDVY